MNQEAPSTGPSGVVKADGATASMAVSANNEKKPVRGSSLASGGSDTSFSSVEELRQKEPELYRLILEGQFVQYMRRQERSQDRIHEMNREMYSK